MSDKIKLSVITMLKQSEYFSLQLDESTEVSGQKYLIVFVRFELNGDIEKEMLFCQYLPIKITGKEVFKSVDNFIKKKMK